MPPSPDAAAPITAKPGAPIKFGLAPALLLLLLWAGPALADPCKAIPDRGPLPPGLAILVGLGRGVARQIPTPLRSVAMRFRPSFTSSALQS